MRRYFLPLLSISLLVAFSVAQKANAPAKPTPAAQSSSITDASRLPVKRVVLYKNGVGYFEHSARVHGNQELSIDFTTAQLNDVLKSLTVVDLGEGRISSVRYNSIAHLDERLKSLRLPFGEQVTRADFLSSLRGARVEVRVGTSSATGRLLSVDKDRRSNGKGEFMDVTTFAIVTDAGEMKNYDLGPGTSVRLADRELNDEVGRYLNLIGSSRARDLRRMTISATGAGDRDIFVSYISEVPVWKSTYRIILPAKPNEKPLLQGWAIVDNTVGEDWKDVQLSLIAGSPQSFIQQISQPYYTRRPVVGLPQSVMLTPQEHEGTVSEGTGGGIGSGSGAGIGGGFAFAPGTGGLQGTVKDPTGAAIAGAEVTIRNEETGASQTTTSDATGTYRFFSVPAGNSALFISRPGFHRYNLTNFYLGTGRMNEIHATLNVASVSETVEVTGAAPTLNTESTQVSVSAVATKQHVEAEGKDLGDYFEYNLKQKITIGKNQSALVPILQARVEAEKVSLWNENSKEIRRALWIRNSSGQTLDSGTFNIVEGYAFSGEGLFDTMHPDERRLISYAADPAVRISMDQEEKDQPVSRIKIVKGSMLLTHERRDSRKYTIRNSDTQPRMVVIEHPARDEWKLAEGAKPEETTASFLRFRVSVPPGQTQELKIEEYKPEESAFELSDLDENEVTLISQQKTLPPNLQDAFHRILTKKNEIDGIETQISVRQKEVDSISKDQARVRENMKALKGSAEEKALVERYAKQLNSQEDRLATMQKEMEDLNNKKDKADAELELLVQGITLDENL